MSYGLQDSVPWERRNTNMNDVAGMQQRGGRGFLQPPANFGQQQRRSDGNNLNDSNDLPFYRRNNIDDVSMGYNNNNNSSMGYNNSNNSSMGYNNNNSSAYRPQMPTKPVNEPNDRFGSMNYNRDVNSSYRSGFQQAEEPSRARFNLVGTVTRISPNDCGMINNETFFQRNVCKGQLPKLGDQVLFDTNFSQVSNSEYATRVQLMVQTQAQQQGFNDFNDRPLNNNDFQRNASQFQREMSPPRQYSNDFDRRAQQFQREMSPPRQGRNTGYDYNNRSGGGRADDMREIMPLFDAGRKMNFPNSAGQLAMDRNSGGGGGNSMNYSYSNNYNQRGNINAGGGVGGGRSNDRPTNRGNMPPSKNFDRGSQGGGYGGGGQTNLPTVDRSRAQAQGGGPARNGPAVKSGPAAMRAPTGRPAQVGMPRNAPPRRMPLVTTVRSPLPRSAAGRQLQQSVQLFVRNRAAAPLKRPAAAGNQVPAKKVAVDLPVKVGIVPNDLEKPITKEELAIIQEGIIDVAIEQVNSSIKPQFKRCNLKSGIIHIVCSDNESCQWLKKNFGRIKNRSGLKIKLVNEDALPKANTVKGVLPESVDVPSSKILATIQAQNDFMDVATWQIIRRQKEDKDLNVVIELDNASMALLNSRNGKLSYRFGIVTFTPILVTAAPNNTNNNNKKKN